MSYDGPKFIYNFPLPKGYLAITLGRYICFNCTQAELIARPDFPAKIAHEIVHFHQIRNDGILKFYSTYIFDYLRNLLIYRNHNQAYLNIRYEIEAYAKENEMRDA